MKKRSGNQKLLKLFVIILIVAMIGLYCIGSFAYVFAETKTRSGIELGATAGCIYVEEFGGVLWGHNENKQYNPASMTKLLTCLIAAEKLDMKKKVEISSEDINLPNNSPYLQVGEEITVENLMHLALIVSNNEATNALALEVSKSIKKFSDLMNKRAKELGCLNSSFGNPTGLDNPMNKSTAYDMALITEAALENSIVAEICAKSSYELPSSNKHESKTLKNTNLFIGGGKFKNTAGKKIKVKSIKEVYGGKTGTTVSGRATMTVAAKINGLNVIAVIYNSTIEERYKDIEKLISYAKGNITPYEAFKKDYKFSEKAKIKCGEKTRISGVAAASGIINLPEGASAALVNYEVIYFDDLTAPIEEGQNIGEVNIYISDDLAKTVDVISAKAVGVGWFPSKIGISNFQTIIICLVLFIIISMFFAVIVIRYKNRRRANELRRKKIQEIARNRLEREQDVKRRDWPY